MVHRTEVGYFQLTTKRLRLFNFQCVTALEIQCLIKRLTGLELMCRLARNCIISSTDFSGKSLSFSSCWFWFMPFYLERKHFLIFFFIILFNFQQSRRKNILKKTCILTQRHLLSSTQCWGRTWSFLTLLFLGKCHLAVPFTNENNGAGCLHSKGKPRRMQSEGKCAWAAAAFHPLGDVGILWLQLTG